MITKVTMPQLGESVVEGTIGKWLVSEGQRVEKDQGVVEVMTDKADSEIPAPVGGVVTKLLAQPGDTVAVGEALCEIDTEAKASAGAGNGTAAAAKSAAGAPAPQAPAATPAESGSAHAAPPSAPRAASPSIQAASLAAHASPSVRKLAREQGVDLDVLANSSPAPVSHNDVFRSTIGQSDVMVPQAGYANGSAAPARASQAAPGSSPFPLISGERKLAFQVPPYVQKPGDEVIPFSRRRRIIADHMVYSKLTAPHVATVAECDLHKTSRMRNQHKDAFKKEGINLTFLAFVAAATTRALQEFRDLNSRVLDEAYVRLKEINLGIAVETPQGLVVPVIRNADDLTVRGLARAIGELAEKARKNELTPDDLAGKTFTISNPGLKGNLFGAAIISQPNTGILRIGEIQKRVVVIEHEDEDLMAIRPVMHVSLSYDHRVVDGVAANSFLFRVVELLETADFKL